MDYMDNMNNPNTEPSQDRPSNKRKSFQQTELKQLAWLTQRPPNLVLDSRQNRLPMRQSGEESARQCRKRMFNPWVMKIPWSRKWQPTPVFLPGKFHGQRSLVIYSPQGNKELNMNEHTLTADKNLLTGSATQSHNQEASWRNEQHDSSKG